MKSLDILIFSIPLILILVLTAGLLKPPFVVRWATTLEAWAKLKKHGSEGKKGEKRRWWNYVIYPFMAMAVGISSATEKFIPDVHWRSAVFLGLITLVVCTLAFLFFISLFAVVLLLIALVGIWFIIKIFMRDFEGTKVENIVTVEPTAESSPVQIAETNPQNTITLVPKIEVQQAKVEEIQPQVAEKTASPSDALKKVETEEQVPQNAAIPDSKEVPVKTEQADGVPTPDMNAIKSWVRTGILGEASLKNVRGNRLHKKNDAAENDRGENKVNKVYEQKRIISDVHDEEKTGQKIKK